MIYWPMIGSDSFGKPIFGDPQPLPCRWEDKPQEIVTSDGRKVMSHAYLLMGVKLVPGSWVYLGGGKDPMADWKALAGTYPKLPTNLQGGREVIQCLTTPDLKAQDSLYEVYV